VTQSHPRSRPLRAPRTPTPVAGGPPRRREGARPPTKVRKRTNLRGEGPRSSTASYLSRIVVSSRDDKSACAMPLRATVER
jgi:hypothetical protein